jgi:chemotaxis protein CheX
MPADTATIALPSVLTFEACEDLFAALKHAQGSDLIIDGSNVSRLGGLAAQILATASVAWAASGRCLTLVNETDDLRQALEQLALWPLPQQERAL